MVRLGMELYLQMQCSICLLSTKCCCFLLHLFQPQIGSVVNNWNNIQGDIAVDHAACIRSIFWPRAVASSCPTFGPRLKRFIKPHFFLFSHVHSQVVEIRSIRTTTSLSKGGLPDDALLGAP